MSVMLDGTTGRGFLAAVTGVAPFDLDAAESAGASRSDLTALLVERAGRWVRRADECDDAHVTDVLVDFCVSVAHGIHSGWRRHDEVLTSAVDALAEIDDELSQRGGLAWWHGEADLERQVAYMPRGPLADSVPRAADLALRRGSTWWVAPTGAVESSRIRAASSEGHRLLDDHWLASADDAPIAIAVDPRARVLEIADARHWVELVEAHPRPSPELLTYDWAVGARDLVLPDWFEVAEEWDGVHVSAAAWLGTAYRLLPLGDGRSTLLAGWHPDGTSWLTSAASRRG
jgi:hypothetical protein